MCKCVMTGSWSVAMWCSRVSAIGFVLAAALNWPGIASGVASSTAVAQEKSTWSGVYTDAQASRGESVYTASCSVCHGDNLGGSEMGPGLAGSSFLEFWDGLSLGDLLQVMSVSMPQDNPGSLETAQYVDVIAYMLQASEMPAGNEELPVDDSGLGEVTIKAQDGQ